MDGLLTLGCDSESALVTALSDLTYRPSVDDPCFDLLNCILHFRTTFGIQWIPVHIKGHQDRYVAEEELTDGEVEYLHGQSSESIHRRHTFITRHYSIYKEPWSI
jgi:hypothetical protein